MTISMDREQRAGIRRWLALLLSPLAWIVYFTLVYLVDETSCGLFYFRSTIGGVTAVTLILLGLTLVTLLACAFSAYLGWQIRQTVAEAAVRPDVQRTTGESRDMFIGLSAILLSVLFALLTVAIGTAVWVLPPC